MKKEIWADKSLWKLAGVYGKGKVNVHLRSKTDTIYKIRSNKDIEKLPPNKKYLFVKLSDWKVIPAENLIAKYPNTKIIVKTNNIKEMKILATTLQKGIAGFLVDKKTSLKEAYSLYKPNPKLKLVDATVTDVKIVEELGKRICVDGIVSYKQGEGLLAGYKTGFMFLTDGETSKNPYVNTRECRVNAGGALMYVLCKRNGIITPRYLDDLVSGDEVVAVDSNGNTRIQEVGRIKKEWRPMTHIFAKYKGEIGSICSQTAETVRLVTSEGTKPVTEIEIGDKLKAYVGKTIGTHFGGRVEFENIVEV